MGHMSHTTHGKDEGPQKGARKQMGEATKAKMETSSRLGRSPISLLGSSTFAIGLLSQQKMHESFKLAATDTDAGALVRDDYVQEMLKHLSSSFVENFVSFSSP